MTAARSWLTLTVLSTTVASSPQRTLSLVFPPERCMLLHLIFPWQPSDGPIGDLLPALGRHPHRASHIHFTLKAPGYDECVLCLMTATYPER